MRRPKLIVGNIERDAIEIKNVVKKGVYVLVANHSHRLWVHVADVFNKNVFGVVCSHIPLSFSYGFGDVIQFSLWNILDVFTLVEDRTNANIQKNHQALVDV